MLLPDGLTSAGPGIKVTANGPLPDVIVTTDASGVYHMPAVLPEGGYTLTAFDPVTGRVARENVFLRAGQDAVHDMRLKGRGTVRVRVVTSGDVPVAAAFVRLQETNYPGTPHEGAVEPANQGVVTFENVFEGPFSVEVSSLGDAAVLNGALAVGRAAALDSEFENRAHA